MTARRHAGHPVVAAIVVAVAVGCAAQQPNSPAPGPTTSAVPVAQSTVSQFDPQWMGLVPNQPQGWKELNRTITGEFQKFSLRPSDETETRFSCNGCAPWTVDLTAYAPGKFDPTDARTGEPVAVNSDGDGFVVHDPAERTATLTWQYADDAWATVTGLTTATTQLSSMIELAHALRPAERTPIRLPMSMPDVPANMPLAEINVDGTADYGTTVTFAPCGSNATGGAGSCERQPGTESLSVHIWPSDGYYGHFQDQRAVPMKIGGKDGLFDDALNAAGDHAAVQVQPGTLVVFDCAVGVPHVAGGPPQAPTSLKRILASLQWATDPGDEASWTPLSDWAK